MRQHIRTVPSWSNVIITLLCQHTADKIRIEWQQHLSRSIPMISYSTQSQNKNYEGRRMLHKGKKTHCRNQEKGRLMGFRRHRAAKSVTTSQSTITLATSWTARPHTLVSQWSSRPEGPSRQVASKEWRVGTSVNKPAASIKRITFCLINVHFLRFVPN